MTFFISGANGFIGKHLCKYLEGKHIVKLERHNYKLTEGEDKVIIHLAAYGNHIYQKDVSEIIYCNISGLRKLILVAKISGFTKFYNISSSSVTLPHQTLYSASKLFGEVMINSYNDPRMVNVRPYSVYGEMEAPHRFIPTVIRCLNSGEEMKVDCEATHDWIYVECFIKAMFNGSTEIGTGVKETNLEIIRMLESISQKKLNYIPVQPMRSYDNDNWVCQKSVPHIQLYDGLKKVYESTPR